MSEVQNNMYRIDPAKRYNVSIDGGNYKHNNVELLLVAPHLIIVRDKNGKEHIYTGGHKIRMDEI